MPGSDGLIKDEEEAMTYARKARPAPLHQEGLTLHFGFALTYLCESRAGCVCASSSCGCKQVMHMLLVWCRLGFRS